MIIQFLSATKSYSELWKKNNKLETWYLISKISVPPCTFDEKKKWYLTEKITRRIKFYRYNRRITSKKVSWF